MPVRNEEKTIRESLQSLVNQSVEDKEIIIVAGRSTDNTVGIVKEFRGVEVYANDGWDLAASMNVGIKKANSEFVFITEGDALYDKDYLKHALKHFDDPTVGGVMGRLKLWVTGRKTFLSRYHENQLNIKFRGDYKPINGWVYREKVLEDAGDFDKNLEVGVDTDLGERVKKLGYRIVYEPKSVWYHEYEQNFPKFLRKTFWSAYSALPFYVKYPREYGIRSMRGRCLLFFW